MKKIILLISVCILFKYATAQSNTSNVVPSESQIIEMIKKAYNYPKDFPDDMNNITITFGTKTFSLKTNTYYSNLVERKVLKILSQENGIYTYEITDNWKSKIISIDKKNNTAKVITSELERMSLCKPAKVTKPNEAEFCLYVQFNITPFYDFEKNQPGAAGSWMINNVQLIKVNGVWKLKNTAELKRKITSAAKPQ